MTQINDVICPHCGNDSAQLIETSNRKKDEMNCFCNVCAYSWVTRFIGASTQVMLSGRKAS